MIKLKAHFEHTIDGKTAQFIMDQDIPIPVAKEMAFCFLKYLGYVEDQARARAEQENQCEPKIEEPVPNETLPSEDIA